MSQYSKGANFERRVAKLFRDKGYFVFRSAGSHTPVDLLCAKAGEIKIFQCQIDKSFSDIKREQLIEIARENNLQAWLVWRDGKKLGMVRIY